MAAAAIYKGASLSSLERKVLTALISTDLHGHEDGTIPATFQIMHMVRHYSLHWSLGSSVLTLFFWV